MSVRSDNFPAGLVAVKPRSISDLLIRALRYLNQATGSVADTASQLDILPYFRDAIELAQNRRFLVPAAEFVHLGELDGNRRQFTWGVDQSGPAGQGTIASPDINYPYPDNIHTLFLAAPNLQLYDSQGRRIAEPGATGGGVAGERV